MPCYYTGSAEGDAKLQAQEANEELTKVTGLLCKVISRMSIGQLWNLPPDVQEWWSEHQKIDKGRK